MRGSARSFLYHHSVRECDGMFSSVVVALIAGQHHPAIPDDPCEIGCYEQTKQKEPEFSPPGASGEIRIVSERALEKRPQVTQCHVIIHAVWLVSSMRQR